MLHGDELNASQPWDIGKILGWSQRFLHSKGFASARLDCELLLAKALDLNRLGLYTNYDRPISAEEQKHFGTLLRRRLAGEPIAYLLGSKEFLRWSFRVGPEVLIPRPETELLVEQAIAFLEARQPSSGKLRVLEVGTGSGCIAISLALACPFVEVMAWDISDKALGIACANARDLGVGERIGFYCLDALSPQVWQSSTGGFALVISNPPYLRMEELPSLAASVRNFEPHRALVGGEDGLNFYRVMAHHAGQLLDSTGRMLWEIGAEQAPAVQDLLAAGAWNDISLSKDYSGLDRIVAATVPTRGSVACGR